MKNLTMYQKSIQQTTGCNYAEAIWIEDWMRNTIFNSTLDHLSKSRFNRGAKDAYNDLKFLRSPEGIEYQKKELGLMFELPSE